DTAFFEKTAKFLHYGAEVAIVTSIEHDHIDIYPSFESYRAAFARFISELPEEGLLVANASDAVVVELSRECARCPVSYFALGDEPLFATPHWLGAPAEQDETGQSFDVFAGGVAAGRAALRLPGRHNLRNALGAIAAAVQGYGAPLAGALRALAEF